MSKPLPPDAPKKGERWQSRDGRTVRVMADPVEGYVIARYKGAGPFILHCNDWGKRFTRAPSTKGQE